MSELPSVAAHELRSRFGRHATIYALGTLGLAVMGVATTATQTRLLVPSQVGRLGVLLTFGDALIVLYDLGVLQGTLRTVMGATGDIEGVRGERGNPAAGVEQREAMTTGVAINVLLAAVGTGIIVLLRDPLARFLLHQSRDADLIVLVACIGAVASVLRLATNITRYERRPAVYSTLHVARPAFTLIGALAFLVQSPTVRSVLVGTLLGLIAATALTFVLTRQLYRPLVSARAARAVWKLGHRWIPDVIALWTLNGTGVFVISRYASDHTVGVYRAAATIAVLMAHFTTVLFIAWGPLTRDPIFRAAADDLGERYLRRTFTTYFMIATISVLFLVAIFEDQLMRIAGPRFAAGAPVIAPIALGSVLYGVFRITYAGSDAKHKVGYFQVLPVISLAVYIVLAVLVAPSQGIYGPAIARGAAYAVGWVGFLIFIVASGSSVPFDVPRVAGAALLGGALLAAERGVPGSSLGVRLTAQVVASIAYAAVLVATRIVPAENMQRLMVIIRSVVPSRRGSADLSRDLELLDPAMRSLLFELIRDRRSPAEVASRRGCAEDEVRTTFVETVRQLSHAAAFPVGDADLTRYLLWRGSTSARDRMARELRYQGIDLVDLDAMRLTVDRLRREHGETLIRLLSTDDNGRAVRRIWEARLAGLGRSQLRRLRWIVRDEVAERPRIDPTRPDGDPLAWCGARLRQLVGAAIGPSDDHALGAYLLSRASQTDRQEMMQPLIADGIEREALEQMDAAVAWLRLMPARRWRAVARLRPEDFGVSLVARDRANATGGEAVRRLVLVADELDDDALDHL